jgi:hypothetical protein
MILNLDVENVPRPRFCTGSPLPSKAEVIVVCVGGCIVIVQLKVAGLGSVSP